MSLCIFQSTWHRRLCVRSGTISMDVFVRALDRCIYENGVHDCRQCTRAPRYHMMTFGPRLLMAARKCGFTDVSNIDKRLRFCGSSMRMMSHATDIQSAKFDRWKSTMSQMYTFIQRATNTTTPFSMPLPPPPSASLPSRPLPGPATATDAHPGEDRSPHDDLDYI
ncbi:hypothetical protein PIB30_060168 [Stylosanthes scabra]|uniref:Uncharacterized protein n=1 Tax=Stylosanthes scabra TaxID=79078 RepID=A0ABU6YJ56_9FABA|nr:hypothetical protein [Stylosanthes scabra]